MCKHLNERAGLWHRHMSTMTPRMIHSLLIRLVTTTPTQDDFDDHSVSISYPVPLADFPLAMGGPRRCGICRSFTGSERARLTCRQYLGGIQCVPSGWASLCGIAVKTSVSWERGVKGMRLVRLQLLERAQLLSACLCGVCAGRMVSREEMLRCNAEASSHSACAVAAISAWLPVGVWWHV